MNFQEQTIWLAAIFEGEGTFDVRRPSPSTLLRCPTARQHLRAALKMSDKDVIENARAIEPGPLLGFRRNLDHTKSATALKAASVSTKPWKSLYTLEWHSQRAEQLMRRIYPFLYSRRKAKIDECLSTPNLSHHPRSAA